VLDFAEDDNMMGFGQRGLFESIKLFHQGYRFACEGTDDCIILVGTGADYRQEGMSMIANGCVRLDGSECGCMCNERRLGQV
jgi:hypothetical protein